MGPGRREVRHRPDRPHHAGAWTATCWRSDLRALRPAAQLPIVVLSSVGGRDREAPAIGAFLTKPVKPSALHDALVTMLADEGTCAAFTGCQNVRPWTPDLGRTPSAAILLAEDNAVNQKLAAPPARPDGLYADVAGNGLEAMAALERGTYDVILMDVQMPEMDGLEATRADPRRAGPGAASADRRDDRERAGGRPRGLPRCRDGRLHHEADPAGRARGGARRHAGDPW